MNTSDAVTLLPTRNRPIRFERAINSILSTADGLQIVAAIDKDDPRAVKIASKYDIPFALCPPKGGCAFTWNAAMKRAEEIKHYLIYVLASDDVVFENHWWDEAMKSLDEIGGSGLVGFNDRRVDGNKMFASHYLMTRDYIIEHQGGVAVIPHYGAGHTDLEATVRARRAGKYIWNPRAVAKHCWEGPESDETYKEAHKKYIQSQVLYHKRLGKGFPNDFEPIITE